MTKVYLGHNDLHKVAPNKQTHGFIIIFLNSNLLKLTLNCNVICHVDFQVVRDCLNPESFQNSNQILSMLRDCLNPKSFRNKQSNTFYADRLFEP